MNILVTCKYGHPPSELANGLHLYLAPNEISQLENVLAPFLANYGEQQHMAHQYQRQQQYQGQQEFVHGPDADRDYYDEDMCDDELNPSGY
jgi:hypothetical protein